MTNEVNTPRLPETLTYIDLFAGCGGLSLGLHNAGWTGMFAIERNPMAFETLQHNLIDSELDHFSLWPNWLPRKACSIQRLTQTHRHELKALRGSVMMIAGGPPCQGFSPAGKRAKNDHRNQLYKTYLDVVSLVRPALVVIENVTGITAEFGGKRNRSKLGPGRPRMAFSERIRYALEKKLHYTVFEDNLLAANYGVPQTRTRFVAIGIDNAFLEGYGQKLNPHEILSSIRTSFLQSQGLRADEHITCQEALSDLIYDKANIAPSPDTKKYMAGKYSDAIGAYQLLMRRKIPTGTVADSHRFVKHRIDIVKRFEEILATCPKGKNIPDEFRKKHGIKKACIVPLDPVKPAGTLTTIPDDMIHYGQPRVLTARECARLQSFPDWFAFKSKYTTGGKNRKRECPRYTQIGNAVPPLLAQAIGRALDIWIQSQRKKLSSTSSSPKELLSA